MQDKYVIVIENRLTGAKEILTLTKQEGARLVLKARSGHRYMVYQQAPAQQATDIPADELDMVDKMRMQRNDKNLRLLLDEEFNSEIVFEDY